MKASWDDYSQYMENHNPNVPNHQPDGLLTMTPDLLHRWLTSAGSVWRRRFWPERGLGRSVRPMSRSKFESKKQRVGHIKIMP